MQSWLVTVDGSISEEEAFRCLSLAGAVPDAQAEVVPFEDGERAMVVDAPAEVAGALRDLPWVRGVFPNSEMTAY